MQLLGFALTMQQQQQQQQQKKKKQFVGPNHTASRRRRLRVSVATRAAAVFFFLSIVVVCGAATSCNNTNNNNNKEKNNGTKCAAASKYGIESGDEESRAMGLGSGRPQQLALFVMGDSLVDAGNNNFIPSTARANFAPHGLDYAIGPTGRFCNGKIINDFISDFVGSPAIKPYLDPTNDISTFLYGSNFASAGAGILNNTGKQFIKVLSADDQLDLFREYKQRLAEAIGAEETEKLVNGALFSLTFGGNDYINNYLRMFSISNRQYNLPQFQDHLISTYKSQLTRLYHMGARKLTITGLGPLGCIPSQLNKNKVANGQCIQALQEIAVSFNAALKSMTEQLNRELVQPDDATFLFIDSFHVAMEFINNPETYGYDASTVTTACCGQGMYNGRFICNRLSSLCPDRRTHVFWDPFHPTEKTNSLIARLILDGPPTVISPVNVRQLLQHS